MERLWVSDCVLCLCGFSCLFNLLGGVCEQQIARKLAAIDHVRNCNSIVFPRVAQHNQGTDKASQKNRPPRGLSAHANYLSIVFQSVLSKNGFDFNAGERDVPEAACFGPVARMVKGPKPAVSVATMA